MDNMPLKNKHLLDRNDVAALIDPKVTVDMVRKNEVRWGLSPHKVTLSRKCVFYRRAGVLKALAERGFIEA